MAVSGSGNNFPAGQCTWWASQRYAQLTGKYVSWNGDAWSWANGAASKGWVVSSKPPPNGVPAIAVLSPGVQGAGGLGHVAVVENNNNGVSVTTSNLNWAGNQTTATQVTFRVGPGVQFVWYPGASRQKNAPNVVYGKSVGQSLVGSGMGASTGVNGAAPAGGHTAQQGNAASAGGTPAAGGYTPITSASQIASTLSGGTAWEPLGAQVHNTLVTSQGWLGIALALDELEQYPGWVNLATGPTDWIGMLRSIGASLSDNFPPLAIRGVTVLVGGLIVLLMITKVAAPAVEQAGIRMFTGGAA